MRIPWLRRLFGSEDFSSTESDIVMIVTPHIVRSHELTVEDLRPLFVGTSQSLGTSPQPQLIAPGTPPPPAAGTPGAVQGGGAPPVTTPPGGGRELPPVGARAPGVVPIEPVGATPQPGGMAQVAVTAPAAPLQAGGPAYNVPITISGATRVGTVALSITYDPKVLRAVSVTPGSFMAQGGLTPAFTPRIDEAAGRVDLAIARPGDTTGASGDGPLAAIVFEAIAAGSSQIVVSGVLNDPAGQPLPARLVPASVTVR
jgi:general secretion pathway protein D